jgi:hypothetical protein
MMTMLVLAHAGHWLANVLYVVPLVGVAVAMLVGRLRERRGERDGDGPKPPAREAG